MLGLMGRAECWWLKAMRIVLLPFILLAALPILVVAGIVVGLTVPFSATMAGLQGIGEKRFRRRMQDRGRFVEWGDLESDLKAGVGTLIIEQGQKCPVRVWWTP